MCSPDRLEGGQVGCVCVCARARARAPCLKSLRPGEEKPELPAWLMVPLLGSHLGNDWPPNQGKAEGWQAGWGR